QVQFVWKQSLSGATILFAINRYITPLKFVVEVVAFHSPAWSKNVLIMMLRVYAIWERNRRILAVLGFLWVTQVAFCTMALVYSQRVPLPPVLVGCILTGSIARGNLFTPFWIMPLITDSAVFLLTLWRTQKHSRRHGNKMPLFHVLQRDGALYFLCIFSANLLNVVLYLVCDATEDLKAIGAGFSQIITCVMISRLVINLRSLRTGVHISNREPIAPQTQYDKYITTETSQKKTFVDTIIGTLVEESGEGQFAHWDNNTLKMQDL
ncbi:hypothetical protein JB92DRAFT_2748461, partial [Gautieria morchelliformis]